MNSAFAISVIKISSPMKAGDIMAVGSVGNVTRNID